MVGKLLFIQILVLEDELAGTLLFLYHLIWIDRLYNDLLILNNLIVLSVLIDLQSVRPLEIHIVVITGRFRKIVLIDRIALCAALDTWHALDVMWQ